MLFVWYKFRHTEHSNTTMQTLFQFITRARLTLVDGTSKWHNSQIFIPHTALNAPSVFSNPHFILVHLVLLIFISERHSRGDRIPCFSF